MKRWWVAGLVLLLGACEADDGKETDGFSREAQATLSLELRSEAQLVVDANGDETRVELTLGQGFGVAGDGETLKGSGRIERFPEADTVLYTARFRGAPVEGGPCGSEPISVALSLHRDGRNTYVGGGLAAYCGADTWFGKPARAPLRLSGRLDAP